MIKVMRGFEPQVEHLRFFFEKATDIRFFMIVVSDEFR